jgi:hypothetical protein
MSAPALPMPPGSRFQNLASLAGVLGAALLVFGPRDGSLSDLPSYLFVWLFLVGLSLGSLALMLVHDLTGGRWGEAIRPALRAHVRMLPIAALLAVPMLLRMPELYAWMRPVQQEAGAGPPSWYLNAGFFWLRWAVYFAVWLALSVPLAWNAGAQDRRGSRAFAAAGLVAYVLTMTFAFVDWSMSLTPHWVSTCFGMLTGIGQVLAALAFAVAVGVYRRDAEVNKPDRVHDLGNLMLALVLVWAYLAFMQYLIMWIEDLPHDISWYLPRTQTSWRGLALFLVCTHFALPFLLLLFRRVKRAPRALAALSLLVLLACLGDLYWWVIPVFRPQGFAPAWPDFFALLGAGGIWLGIYLRLIRLGRAHDQFVAGASDA